MNESKLTGWVGYEVINTLDQVVRTHASWDCADPECMACKLEIKIITAEKALEISPFRGDEKWVTFMQGLIYGYEELYKEVIK